MSAAIVLPRRIGRPIVAYPSRLASAAREGFGLFKGSSSCRPRCAAHAGLRDLMRVFGLTAAEARLADRLLGGELLEAAAESLGVSYWTARNQLKRSIKRQTRIAKGSSSPSSHASPSHKSAGHSSFGS